MSLYLASAYQLQAGPAPIIIFAGGLVKSGTQYYKISNTLEVVWMDLKMTVNHLPGPATGWVWDNLADDSD
jgi:hypothetical protein